jgi:hypothetical protein
LNRALIGLAVSLKCSNVSMALVKEEAVRLKRRFENVSQAARKRNLETAQESDVPQVHAATPVAVPSSAATSVAVPSSAATPVAVPSSAATRVAIRDCYYCNFGTSGGPSLDEIGACKRQLKRPLPRQKFSPEENSLFLHLVKCQTERKRVTSGKSFSWKKMVGRWDHLAAEDTARKGKAGLYYLRNADQLKQKGKDLDSKR